MPSAQGPLHFHDPLSKGAVGEGTSTPGKRPPSWKSCSSLESSLSASSHRLTVLGRLLVWRAFLAIVHSLCNFYGTRQC